MNFLIAIPKKKTVFVSVIFLLLVKQMNFTGFENFTANISIRMVKTLA